LISKFVLENIKAKRSESKCLRFQCRSKTHFVADKTVNSKGVKMKFKFAHNNFNVLNIERSLKFYDEALGLKETRRINSADGAFIIVYLGDQTTPHKLELTWLRDRAEKYDLGDNEFHLAFTVDDFQKAFERHKEMKCICYENERMGIYFIEDPDGYWLEVLPDRHQAAS